MSGISAALPAVPLYLADSRTETAHVTSFESSDPQTRLNTAYFQKVAANLTTPDKLLGDYRALSVVLNAFGISSDIQSTALLRKLMTQDPTQSTSLANTLGDAKLQRFARAMNGFNPPPFGNAGDVTATITAAATNSYEHSQDTLSPGLQQALYFNRTVGNVTTVNQLMSDPTLLKVAVVAAGLDVTQFGGLNFAQQQTIVTKTIKLSDFQSPAKVNQMAESFLVRQGQSSSGGTTTADMALSLLNGTADGSGQSLLGALYGQTATSSTDILSSLYPASSTSGSDPMLQLFA